MNTAIVRTLIGTADRMSTTAELFGSAFPLRIEPFVYTVTGQLAPAYRGAYWHYYRIGADGFYMAPDLKGPFQVSCEMNYFRGELSADALGLVVCLTAFSHLSFSPDESFARVCARHFYRLRNYAGTHPEAALIYAAID